MFKFDLQDIADYAKSHADNLADSVKQIVGINDEEKAANEYRSELNIESITSLLPYMGWDPIHSMFILDNGEIKKDSDKKLERSIGFCLEFTPQTGATNSMESVLQALFLQAAPGTSFSFHNYASPNIMDPLKKMARKRYADTTLGVEKPDWEKRNTNIYQLLARQRIDFYLQGSSKSLFGEKMNVMTRDFRCVLSVNLPYDPDDEHMMGEAITIKDQVKSTLMSANFAPVEWKPADLINFVSDFLDYSRWQHTPSRITKEYEKHTPIRKQMGAKEVSSTVKSESIDFTNDMGGDETSLVQLSVSQYPKFFHLSMMGSLIGDQFQSALAYSCPFLITTTAVVQNYDSMRNRADLKLAGAVRKSEGWSAKIDPLIYEELAEWREAQKAIEDGGTLIRMATSITLLTRKKDTSKIRSEVMAIWRTKGFRLAIDKYQQLITFMASMPMAMTPAFYSDLKKQQRFSTKYSHNAVSLSPLIGEWKGTPTPVMTLFGRRGQLMTIDLFDNKAGNFNFCCVGSSGSGKSFFVQELLMSYRAIGTKIWVIDVGRSYENICKMLDGDFIEFTEDSNICINPFTHILDLDDEMGMLKPLVAMMMSPNETLDAWSIATIEKAIREVHRDKGNDMTITDVSNFLLNYKTTDGRPDQRYADLGHQLYTWTVDGAYGKYFNGAANVTFKNEFTVLELEELKGKKELQSVVLLIMIHRISNEMYGNRNIRKICMIDEAWDIMSGKNETASEFIETGYRRVRKENGAFGTATQNYADYFSSPAAQAAFQNADWTFTLAQKDESIKALEDKGLMGLKDNPYKLKYFYDLTKVNGMYSDVYIQYPEGEGGARLIVDPYSALLYSSQAEHFARIRSYKKQGFNTAEAVTKTLKDFDIQMPKPIQFNME